MYVHVYLRNVTTISNLVHLFPHHLFFSMETDFCALISLTHRVKIAIPHFFTCMEKCGITIYMLMRRTRWDVHVHRNESCSHIEICAYLHLYVINYGDAVEHNTCIYVYMYAFPNHHLGSHTLSGNASLAHLWSA